MVAATTMTVIKKKQMEQEGSSSAQKKRNSMLARERNAAIAAAEEAEEARLAAMHPARRTCVKALDVLGSTSIQTTLYLIFVLVFQFLGSSMRILDEFYVDKLVMDRLVENHFDSSHNTFESIRRTADVWEWGNNVLWPGLLGDLGPCTDKVGSLLHPKACVDEAWPDGDGSFHLEGATPFEMGELVERMDQLDWTEGLTIRQGRAAGGACEPPLQTLGECYTTLGSEPGSQVSFGFNWTDHYAEPAHPWDYFSAEQLGATPNGVNSAAFTTQANYDASGFVALVIPFFSEVFLPEEEGPASTITDYREHYVNVSNGKSALYYCVRLSPNGKHVKQLCDPGSTGNGTGVMTGAVRAAVEEMWNDLKRGHFIDARTRVITFTLQLKSNPLGVRYRTTLMLEQTASGTWFPSYDVETRVLGSEPTMLTFANIALVMVIFFCLMEGIDLINGPVKYFQDVWNVMDWINFIFFYLAYGQIQAASAATYLTPDYVPCTSELCSTVGYFDDWLVMGTFRQAKMLYSLCACIQLFKILKFASVLVPKMGLATAVLKKAVMDLVFFGVVFIISMMAFAMMLFVQLGPVMQSYMGFFPAIIALARALFGDFDIDEIMDNSGGYMNVILFLSYLFVAVFIMLSMFLAILAEAQVDVREDEKKLKERYESEGREDDEYGVVSATIRMIERNVTTPLVAKIMSAVGGAADEEKVPLTPAEALAEAKAAVEEMQQQRAPAMAPTMAPIMAPAVSNPPAASPAMAPAASESGDVSPGGTTTAVATSFDEQMSKLKNEVGGDDGIERIPFGSNTKFSKDTPLALQRTPLGNEMAPTGEGDGWHTWRERAIFEDIGVLREQFEELGQMRKDSLLWQSLAMEQSDKMVQSHESIKEYVAQVSERMASIETLLWWVQQQAAEGQLSQRTPRGGAVSEAPAAALPLLPPPRGLPPAPAPAKPAEETPSERAPILSSITQTVKGWVTPSSRPETPKPVESRSQSRSGGRPQIGRPPASDRSNSSALRREASGKGPALDAVQEATFIPPDMELTESQRDKSPEAKAKRAEALADWRSGSITGFAPSPTLDA